MHKITTLWSHIHLQSHPPSVSRGSDSICCYLYAPRFSFVILFIFVVLNVFVAIVEAAHEATERLHYQVRGGR